MCPRLDKESSGRSSRERVKKRKEEKKENKIYIKERINTERKEEKEGRRYVRSWHSLSLFDNRLSITREAFYAGSRDKGVKDE